MEHDELTIPRPFRPVRCAIYTRQSVVRPETEELTSCTVQRELCERHIRSRRMEGWYTLPERFDDEGASGASTERSALNRLLEKIEAGVVDRVVVYSLDRITRRLLDWAEMLALFERHGVKLSIAKGELSESDLLTSQLAMNVLASLAEFERGLIRERLLDARAAKRQHGLRSAGLLPFGFTSAPATRQLKPLASECELVRRVFERAAAGAKPVEIATWLNQQGIATKKSGQVGGKPWTARAVLRVIGNRVYLGEIGGVRAAHDAVIDGDLFEKANATVGARRTRAPNRTRVDEKDDPFLLRGKVRCIHCGRAMTTATGKQKHKRARPQRFYRCRGTLLFILWDCRGWSCQRQAARAGR